jgi:hypothetical protein
MKKSIFSSTVILLLFCSCRLFAQGNEYYDLSRAVADAKSATALVVNLNNFEPNLQPIVNLDLTGLSRLKNLEELIIFPVNSSIYGPFTFKEVRPGEWETDDLPYQYGNIVIPEEIENCQKLRVISANDIELRKLPIGLSKLQRLERLELSGSTIPSTELMEILPKLKNLRLLNLYNAGLDSSTINALRLALPLCEILIDFEDLTEALFASSVKYNAKVGVTDIYIAFPSKRRAQAFINSLNPKLVDRYKIEYFEFE